MGLMMARRRQDARRKAEELAKAKAEAHADNATEVKKKAKKAQPAKAEAKADKDGTQLDGAK